MKNLAIIVVAAVLAMSTTGRGGPPATNIYLSEGDWLSWPKATGEWYGLRTELAENGIEGVTVINAAVVPDSFTGEYVPFHITAAFWASSLHPAIAGKFKSTKSVEVPAVTISELMVEHKPSVVVMDIEGSERDLFEAAWPAHVRLLVIELHPRIYSDRTIKQIFDQMSASGLTYCPVGSRGNVVVFRRVTDST